MKVAVIQAEAWGNPASFDLEQNRATLPGLVERVCEEHHPDFVGLPEVSTAPYFCAAHDPRYRDLAEAIPGPASEALGELARRHSTIVAAGLFERAAAGVHYGACMVIGPDGKLIPGRLPGGGTLPVARKAHIPAIHSFTTTTDEKFWLKPGEGLVSFETRHGTIGVLICYDRSFPEAWQTLVLAANRAGPEAVEGREVVVAEIDLAEAGRQRIRVPYFRDRRPEVYHLCPRRPAHAHRPRAPARLAAPARPVRPDRGRLRQRHLPRRDRGAEEGVADGAGHLPRAVHRRRRHGRRDPLARRRPRADPRARARHRHLAPYHERAARGGRLPHPRLHLGERRLRLGRPAAGNPLHAAEGLRHVLPRRPGGGEGRRLRPRRRGRPSFVNGAPALDTRTSDMVFPVREIVSFCSRVMTPLPGDVISTGACGVGQLAAGDLCEIEIDGIGRLGNHVERG